MDKLDPKVTTPPRGAGIRAVYLWIGGALGATLIGGAFIVLSLALSERDARRTQLPQMAGRLSLLLDREIETTLARLVGLSSSPALMQDDLQAFHQQMVRTPIPKGTVLAISDQTRQLANAAMPFGTALPALSAYTPQPQFFERLEAEGRYISSRVYGPIARIHAVTVSMKIPNGAGRLKYILTTAILGDRLADLMRRAETPLPGGRIMLIDAMGQDLTAYPDAGPVIPVPELVKAGLTAPRGLVANDAAPVITGYDRSALTGWTVAVAAPHDWVAAPLSRARHVLLVMGAVVLAVTALIALILRNRVSRPLQAMAEQLQDAKREVMLLGDTLIVARTQEHRRIAQELHDTTAQKLVAADLYLQSMGRVAPLRGDEPAQLPMVRALLSQALEELRTFSFLLRPNHPPDEGFRDCLAALVEGFCDRAGLRCKTDFGTWLDDLDEAAQTAFLRVTRAALSNIYRHAHARSVSATAEAVGGTYVLTIEDDGLGGISYPSKGPMRVGLGITGMHEALAERSGTLEITPLTLGTRLSASLPATVSG